MRSCRTIHDFSCRMHVYTERRETVRSSSRGRGCRCAGSAGICSRFRPGGHCRRRHLLAGAVDGSASDDRAAAANRASGRATPDHAGTHRLRRDRRRREGRRDDALPGGQGRHQGVRTSAAARRRHLADDRARPDRSRRSCERPEGHPPCAPRPPGRDRPARRRGLAGARADVRGEAREGPRPEGRGCAHRARRASKPRAVAVPGRANPQEARDGSRDPHRARDEQPRADPARLRDPEAEGRRRRSSTRRS